MGVNDIESACLSIQVKGVAGLELFFEIDRRVRIVLAGDGQDGLECAVDLGVSSGEQFHMVAAVMELLAEVVDDPLRSAMALGRNRDINARNLGDLHGGARDRFHARATRGKGVLRFVPLSIPPPCHGSRLLVRAYLRQLV